MQKFLRLFRDSARELKSPRTLAVAGMLIALNVVMAALNIRIQFTPDLRVDFGFLCSAMIGMLLDRKSVV